MQAPNRPQRRRRRIVESDDSEEEVTYEVAPTVAPPAQKKSRAQKPRPPQRPAKRPCAEARPVLRENARLTQPSQKQPRRRGAAPTPRPPTPEWDVDPDDEDEIQREREAGEAEAAAAFEASQAKARTKAPPRPSSSTGGATRAPLRSGSTGDTTRAPPAQPPVPCQLTADQRAVAAWRPPAWAADRRGKLVRVVAHAGTGKTTTLAALAANLAASAKPKEGEQPWLKLSYWTFNRSAAADAAQRFGGRTTRYGVDARSINSALLAFVQKGERDAGRDRLECPTRLPQTMEALATILDALGLGDIAEDRISSQKLKGDRETKKKAADTLRRSLARSAWRTVENFCNSADDDVKEKHVPRDVVRADDAFRSKHAPPSGSLRPYCSRWAKELYRRAADPNDDSIACTQNVMQKVALKRLRQHPDEKLGWGWGGGPPPHVLLLDEAQDLDECMLAVVDIQRKRGPTAVVLVGDPAQALYGFRGASADALRDTARFGEADTEFALARSFRFGPSIAREANRLLATKRRYDRTFSYTPVVGLGPKGSSEKDSVVKSWGESGLPTPPYAYICRSNRGAVDAAAKVCGLAPEKGDDATFDPFAEDAAIAFAGDKGQQLLASQLRTLEDVAELRQGRPPESRAVRKWASFPELERAVQDEDAGDGKGSLVERNVRDAFELCRRWGPMAGKLAAALRRAAQRGATDEGRRRAVVFTTSHKAKGLEWDTVVVHDDFAPFVDDLGDPVSFVHAEEINAWHVAVTRARRTLYIPPKLDALRAWCEQQDAAPGAPATPRPRGGLSLAALMGGGGMLSGTVSQSQRSVRRAGPDGW